MSRVEENEIVINNMKEDMERVVVKGRTDGLFDPRVTTNINLSMIATSLTDISRSLAIIADSLSQEEE